MNKQCKEFVEYILKSAPKYIKAKVEEAVYDESCQTHQNRPGINRAVWRAVALVSAWNAGGGRPHFDSEVFRGMFNREFRPLASE